jgi:hypothetical protein
MHDNVRVHGVVLDAATRKPLVPSAVFLGLQFRGETDKFVREPYRCLDGWVSENGSFSFDVPTRIGPVRTHGTVLIVWSPGHETFFEKLQLTALVEHGAFEIVLGPGEREEVRAGAFDKVSRRPLADFPLSFKLGIGRKDAPLAELDREDMAWVALEARTGPSGWVTVEVPPCFSYSITPKGSGVYAPSSWWHMEDLGHQALGIHTGGTLLVEVRDSRGAPAPQAIVTLHDPSGPVVPLSLDREGRCRCIGLRGRCVLSAQLPQPSVEHRLANVHDVASVRSVVDVMEGETKTVVLEVPDTAAELTVTLRHNDGSPAPLQPLWISALSGDPFEEREVESDAGGAVRFGFFVPGKYAIFPSRTNCWPRGHAPLSEVTLEPGQNEVELVVRRGETLAGRVVDESGAPVPGAQVHAVAHETRTDEEGRFSIPAVERGSVHVSVFSHHGGRRREGSWTLTHDGMEQTLTLTARPVFRIRVHVVKEAPRKWARFPEAMLIAPAVGRPHQTHGRPDGSGSLNAVFEFEGLDPDVAATAEKKLIFRGGCDCVPITLAVPPGPEPVIEGVVLETGYTLRGKIDDPYLARGARPRIEVESENIPGGLVRAHTEPDGHFEIMGLPGEPLNLKVRITPPLRHDDAEAEVHAISLRVNPAETPDLGTLRLIA